jgi:hypothetical protein
VGMATRLYSSWFWRTSSQSGSSSSGMSCCRMEWPDAPSGAREMELTVTLQ